MNLVLVEYIKHGESEVIICKDKAASKRCISELLQENELNRKDNSLPVTTLTTYVMATKNIDLI
ncbi:MAG: hypothetical protein HQK77_19430 [Desulfobacterales bacterium]|nr:hypothetical protein [Desulfobacterales bacterium]